MRRHIILDLPGETVVLDVPFVPPMQPSQPCDPLTSWPGTPSSWLRPYDVSPGYSANMVNGIDGQIQPFSPPDYRYDRD